MPGILLELSRIADETGIRFKSITPQPALPIGAYQVVPIDVAFDGSFYALSDFLFRLRTLVTVRRGELHAAGRLFSVASVDFSESDRGFPLLAATLKLNAYIYGLDAAGAAAPPAAATPPATTTRAPARRQRGDRKRGDWVMAKRVDPLKAKEAKQKKIAIGRRRPPARAARLPGPEDAEDAAGPTARLSADLDRARDDDARRCAGCRCDRPQAARRRPRPRPSSPRSPTPISHPRPSRASSPPSSASPARIRSRSRRRRSSRRPPLPPSRRTAPRRSRPTRRTTPSRPRALPEGDGAADGGFTTGGSTPDAPEVAGATSISVNGVAEDVAVEGSFPKDEPTFVLVKIAKNGKSVEIGIAGGEYAGGDETITLALGQEADAPEHGRRQPLRASAAARSRASPSRRRSSAGAGALGSRHGPRGASSSRPTRVSSRSRTAGSSSTHAMRAGTTPRGARRSPTSRATSTSHSSASTSACSGRASRCRCTTGRPTRRTFSSSPARRC